jgi:hypothetical protein
VPGKGVVVQHVEPISLSRKFAEFEAGYMDDDFCAALA